MLMVFYYLDGTEDSVKNNSVLTGSQSTKNDSVDKELSVKFHGSTSSAGKQSAITVSRDGLHHHYHRRHFCLLIPSWHAQLDLHRHTSELTINERTNNQSEIRTIEHMTAKSIKHKTYKYMHGWAKVSVNKFSYRGCARRSPGHLSKQFYELRSYCDGVF